MNIITKKAALICTFIFAFSLLRAQYVSLPDTAWGAWLSANGYASALTGNSTSGWNLDTTSTSVLTATDISVNGNTAISSIEGVQYFKGLTGLTFVNDFNLASISSLPVSLLHLELTQTGLVSLPPLPGGLQDLEIDGTPLTTIGVLPSSLLRLWCGYGAPKVFTAPLPPDLADFECASAGLNSLPAIPSHVQILNCSFNQLTTLPQLPDTMMSLIADNNALTSLTNLPLVISADITLSDNPNLTCLPPFSYISNLSFSNTAIACTPSYNVAVSTPTITTIPLCTTSNPNGCLFETLVYPGDANNDRHADNVDLLNIGLGYNATGSPRSGASIVWVGQSATDWTDTFITGLNYKFADCNGDGTIDADDTVAIVTNFGLTHSKTDGAQPWRSGTPGIRVVFSADTLRTGDTLITTFILGDSSTPATNISGLAFTYQYDALVVDTTAVTFGFIPSWLGTAADAISISKNYLSAGTLKGSITRIDHTNRSGYGAIARMYTRITSDNINGKDYAYYSNLGFISDITAMDAAGHLITLNAGQDSSHIEYTPTGIHEIHQTAQVTLYPNPASDIISLSSPVIITDMTVYDVLGQQVLSSPAIARQTATIDISTLKAGVYMAYVRTASGTKEIRMAVTR